jgi:hypothetical protein
MQQLHDREIMRPHAPTEITAEHCQDALAYLMFLKRKLCGKIKSKGCTNGCKQQAYTLKEEALLPMVTTAAVFLTSIIDAWEKRDVATVDIPGAFMHVDMDELVYVRFIGPMVEQLLEIAYDTYTPT